MSTRPAAGEEAPQVRAAVRRWPSAWSWAKSPAAWTGLVLALGTTAGVLYWTTQGRGTFPRRGAAFPSQPQITAAIASAQERLKGNPQDIDALTELGTLHFEKGRELYPEAINELEEARELGSLDSRIFYCLGVMYQELGLYPFALEEYKRFLRNHPEDKEIRMLAAKLLYKQGGFAEAVIEYERLKFRDPSDRLVEENLGLSLWGAKQLDRAEGSFRQLKTMGDEPAKRAEFYLGQLAMEKGDYKGALEHLLLSLPGNGVDIGLPLDKVYAALGVTYQKLERPQEAKEAWQKVLGLTPGDAKAQASLKELNRRFPAKRVKK